METMTQTFSIYEQACSQCIDDLYHTAYLVFVDSTAAEKLVTEICVAGVHKYGNMEDLTEIRICLTSDLYNRAKRRLWCFTSNTNALPDPLQVLTKQERLLVAIRFSSGLSSDQSGRILGLTQEQYRKVISDIIRKTPLMI